MQVAIVIPTIRKDCIEAFMQAWRDEFAPHRVIVMEDNPQKTFVLAGDNLTHLSWQDIDDDLGAQSWIIPRRTDCVRSYGYSVAWREGADVIITLDDDCFPAGPEFVATHVDRLMRPASESAWTSTGDGVQPRGMPYIGHQRKSVVGISHGLWTNVPDLDAMTQLMGHRTPMSFEPKDQVIPRGQYYPMCGMNLAWRAELTPAMYFLLMGKGHGVDRFGDIWAGVLSKKICDHLGYAVHSGLPIIEHRRASNVWTNLAKEAPGYPLNEAFWEIVDRAVLTETDIAGCYQQLADVLSRQDEPIFAKLGEAMGVWTTLFEPAAANRIAA